MMPIPLITRRLMSWFHPLLDFVYPNQCILCDEAAPSNGDVVCSTCWGSLRVVDGVVTDGLMARDAMDEIRAGYYYDDSFRAVIHYLKYQGYSKLAEKIAIRLNYVLSQYSEWKADAVIVPVPMHRIKRRERGYNQAAEIARGLANLSGLPYREDVLLRRVNTVSQTKMSEAYGRVDNMQEVFCTSAGSNLSGIHVILVDDVITTGATANACARALKRAGAASVRVLTAGRPYFGGAGS